MYGFKHSSMDVISYVTFEHLFILSLSFHVVSLEKTHSINIFFFLYDIHDLWYMNKTLGQATNLIGLILVPTRATPNLATILAQAWEPHLGQSAKPSKLCPRVLCISVPYLILYWWAALYTSSLRKQSPRFLLPRGGQGAVYPLKIPLGDSRKKHPGASSDGFVNWSLAPS